MYISILGEVQQIAFANAADSDINVASDDIKTEQSFFYATNSF